MIEKQLPNSNLRITPQRKVILEELGMADSHLTADEVYKMVRARLPRISLGTVYRNLEIFSRLGMIHKLELGGMQKRFDGKTQDHYHLRCLRCGRIDDVPMEPQTVLEESVEGLTDYKVLGHRLEFVGLCLTCREKPETRAHKGA
ncbi:MAG: transcriptional repressor [Deltaproteobacteria bacterium]|nr:transcriptional repressor [Deltaproteobacteria bacterium]